ncbi:hypothetical protein GF371_05530 [Candidatus Woesearchaeota archaeon]|nr:hypothetical protein [Candidatus Woesearchaeota archaeon]
MRTKNLVIILVFVVIAVIAVAYVMKSPGIVQDKEAEEAEKNDRIVIELDKGTEKEAADETETGKKAKEMTDDDKKAVLDKRIEEKLNPTPVPKTEDGTVVMNEEFAMKKGDFPIVKTAELEAGARYNVYFETGKQIQFVVYNQRFYDMWKEKGTHTIAKATTNSVSKCCQKSGSFNFDVNVDEGGTFYFVFDGAQIPDKSQLPKNGKLVVRKNENI